MLWRVVRFLYTGSFLTQLCLFLKSFSIIAGVCAVVKRSKVSSLCGTYVEFFEDRMFFYSWEHDSHGVVSILKERNLDSVHVVGQFLDVCLQFCKGCRKESNRRYEVLNDSDVSIIPSLISILFINWIQSNCFSVSYLHVPSAAAHQTISLNIIINKLMF